MKKLPLSMITLFLTGALLISCANNPAIQAPTLDANAIRTQAVATYASSLTEEVDSAPVSSSTPVVEMPTATALVTVTLEPSPTSNPCYNLMYLEDLTVPDGAQMKPGEVFTKTWQVQNIGGCAWRSGFTFQHVGGDAMRGNPVVLTEAIQTGSKREISVELVVPSGINGVIESAWRMADDTGNFFGDTLTVQIIVGDVTTPAVTSTP